MRIYLVRHGKAIDEGYRFDSDRPLSDAGRPRMRRIAKAWAKEARPEAPELWLTSPLVRAVQTCEICVDAFGADGPVEVSRALVPEGAVSGIAELLERAGMPERVALVGHEPLISDAAAFLLGRHWSEGFKKGAVMSMDRAPGASHATFGWYLEPAKGEKEPTFRHTL